MIQSKLQVLLTPAFLETFLFSLLILLLPTQLGKHFWPDWSLVYSLKIDYLAVKICLWDLLVYGLLFVYLNNKPLVNWKAFSIFGLFIFLSSLSLVFIEDWGVGISRLVNWIPAGLFGVYLASKPGEFIREKILQFLPAALIFSAVLAFMQFLFSGTIGFWLLGERDFDLSTPGIATFNWYGQVFLRPYATFPHPNVLGAFMLLSGLLLLFLHKSRSYYQIFTQLMVVLTVLVSFSRASIALYTVLFFFLLRRQVMYLVLIVILLSPLLYVRFESAFNFDQLSVIRREELAQTAWKITELNPILGVGLNNYIPTAVSASFLSGTNRFLQPVHNIFLLTLSESGLIGLIGFLILLVSPLFFYRKDNLLRKSQVTALVMIICFFGMVDHYLLTLAQGQRLMFLLWGISWCRIRR
jgi:O-antigen ligase